MRTPRNFLIDSIKKGDERAFQHLYSQWHGKVFHFCLKHVGHSEFAEELTADVFVIVWKKRFVLDAHTSISGLLFKIAKDLCFDHLRKTSRVNRLRKIFLESFRPYSIHTPLDDLVFEEYQGDLQIAIDKLPERCGQIFQLSRQGFSHHDIACKLDISINTVKVQIFRARKMIKGHLRHLEDMTWCWVIAVLLILPTQ